MVDFESSKIPLHGILSMLLPLFVLLGLVLCGNDLCVLAERNIFGIGVYTDTPGSPQISDQINLASSLTGRGGWVVLYLCAWKDPNHSCVNRSTTHDPRSNEMLEMAYSKGLNVIARIGNPYYVREHSDEGSNYTSYKGLAKAYASLVGSFPMPPGDRNKLYVQVGNEFNACNEWRCKAGSSSSSISALDIAKEVGGFYSDVLESLIPIRDKHRGKLMLGHGAIASWFKSPCQCGTGQPQGKGQLGLNFLKMMIHMYPKLYTNVDFLSSHSYPFSQQPYGTPKAMRGLSYYRNESIVIGRPIIPVHVTETGWRRLNVSFVEQAQWMVNAFKNLWISDNQVLSICPFLLAGEFWDLKSNQKTSNNRNHSSHGGWTWINSSTLEAFPVFSYVKRLRERSVRL